MLEAMDTHSTGVTSKHRSDGICCWSYWAFFACVFPRQKKTDMVTEIIYGHLNGPALETRSGGWRGVVPSFFTALPTLIGRNLHYLSLSLSALMMHSRYRCGVRSPAFQGGIPAIDRVPFYGLGVLPRLALSICWWKFYEHWYLYVWIRTYTNASLLYINYTVAEKILYVKRFVNVFWESS